MKGIVSIFICVLLLSGIVHFASAQVFIIANNSVSETKLDREAVERIFLGKKLQWSDGSLVVPVSLRSGGVHKAFMKNFLDRDPSQFSTYWKQAVFTGRGVPPKSFEREADLIEFVAQTPGAIGYVSSIPSSKQVCKIDIK